jgi:ATP-dependent Clp protease ATP-binding subunit ClpC
MGHHHIGTEHLLLGILTEADSDEAKAIKAAGATLEGARDKVVEAVGTKLDTYEGDPEFTARARRAIERASRFSLQRLDEHVEVEHLLLGVLDVEGTACQVLRGLGVDVPGLHRAIERTPHDAPHVREVRPLTATTAPTGTSPLCPVCGEVLAMVLNHRVLTATDEAGTERQMVVAFCSGCGSALGVTPT